MNRHVYHITHLENLPSIINAGFHCDRTMRQHGHVDIGYNHIKDRRIQRPVTCAAGGTLVDYVPFYFAPRSPMLFTIDKQNTDYQGGQEPIVHVVFDVAALAQLGQAMAFSDRHADLGHALFYDDLSQLENVVDWGVMQSLYWNNTADDRDRKERRQAELLVHQSVPWTAVCAIGVFDAGRQAAVQALVSQSTHQPVATVQAAWYY